LKHGECYYSIQFSLTQPSVHHFSFSAPGACFTGDTYIIIIIIITLRVYFFRQDGQGFTSYIN